VFSKALVIASVAGVAAAIALPTPTRAQTRPPVREHFSTTVSFMATLRDRSVATIYTDGRVVITPPKPAAAQGKAIPPSRVDLQRMRPRQMRIEPMRYGLGAGAVDPGTRRRIVFDIEYPPREFVPNRVVVVLKPGISAVHDIDQLDAATASKLRKAAVANGRNVSPHAFTTDALTNAALYRLGVDRMQRLFTGVGTAAAASIRSRAESSLRHQLVPFENAYVLRVAGASPRAAARQLRALSSVAYAAPDRVVSSMIGSRITIPQQTLQEFANRRPQTAPFGRSIAATAGRATMPTNTSLAVSLQALLNAPGVDAAAAFDEIATRFNELPGTGEIVTNVSLGDADDASAANRPNDPCRDMVSQYGGTTHVVGGQRYLDWPGMPLIPVWVSDSSGTLSGTAEVCNVDPTLGEAGLDFSMMAALPDDKQRAGEQAASGVDLLGIAPGASYRLVMPQGDGVGDIGESDILGAFVAAAMQAPAPNVITASVGMAADSLGLPSRYLEDDPLAQSVISGIVNGANVVVCISANDGTRQYTAAPIGPSGGSAPTNIAQPGAATTLDDLFYTTAPSADVDSGAIDAGASTLDDVIAANPQDVRNAALANTKAFSETRFDGMLAFSSGFGSRVSLSAPGDNVVAYEKDGTAYDATGSFVSGGTSASAPQIAAAAAVALQVARLTGRPFARAADVRSFLQSTATAVATPPNSDVPLNVGPQVSVRRAVEQLLTAAGKPVSPGVARVAVQPRSIGFEFAAFGQRLFGSYFSTAADPAYMKLDGPWQTPGNGDPIYAGSDTGANLNSYLTIAPDWEGIPATASYRLFPAGHPSRVMATTAFLRATAPQLFALAGVALIPGQSRSIQLTYEADLALKTLARTTFTLTFGPPASTSRVVFAPKAPAVVSGPSFQVSYDLSKYPRSLLAGPRLNVSLPGETDLDHQLGGIYPLFSVPIGSPTGSVTVPTSALAGAGTYTVWIDMRPNDPTLAEDRSDAAFVRVAPAAGAGRPPAPLLSPAASGAPFAHAVNVPFDSRLSVSYDVSSVPSATGAIVEVSAMSSGKAFTFWSTMLNMFDNPNGDRIDHDGVETPSRYHASASGTRGTVTIDLTRAGVYPTNYANVRVLATRGGTVVGEGSDFSTFCYEGINPLVPVPVVSTILNERGTDGGMVGGADIDPTTTSTQMLQQFDLTSATVTGLPLEGATVTNVFPLVQGDLALASVAPTVFAAGTLYEDDPFATAGAFAPTAYPFASPSEPVMPWAIAPQSSPTRAAYLYYTLPSYVAYVVRGDFRLGTGFSQPIDVSSAIEPNDDLTYQKTFDYDAGLDRAYLLFTPAGSDCVGKAPSLVTIDFATRSVTRRTLAGVTAALFGQYMFRVDPSSHTGVAATTCQRQSDGTLFTDLTFVDLRSGAVRRVLQRTYDEYQNAANGGAFVLGDSAFIGVDSSHGLVLQRSIACPAVLSIDDDHARPCLNEYDENGTLVKTIPDLFDDGYPYGNPALEIAQRRGADPADEDPGSFWLEFDAVQPYSY